MDEKIIKDTVFCSECKNKASECKCDNMNKTVGYTTLMAQEFEKWKKEYKEELIDKINKIEVDNAGEDFIKLEIIKII